MGRMAKSQIDRFIRFIIKDDMGCWLWQGHLDKNGYGSFWQKTGHRAHRWSYEYYKEKIPQGLTIDHLCRVKNCVNPDHLEVVTNRENILRAKPVNKSCKNGHLYSEHGFLNTLGRKACRICSRGNTRRWRENIIITEEK